MRILIVSIELALALGACVLGPSDPFFDVWTENDSAGTYLVLVDDYRVPSTHVYRVTPKTSAVTVSRFGESRGGSIVVMDLTCKVLAEFAITSHLSGVVIAEDGSIEYVAGRARKGVEDGPRQFQQTDDCLPPKPT